MLGSIMRLLIVNPYASGVTDERAEQVRAALGAVELEQTKHPGHATELARASGDAEAVYVFSGDGTFNEVLNGIGPDTPVGFIPGGGANVLPRALGLPRDPVAAAVRVATGTVRRISLGRVNGRRFGFAAGVGLDAEAVRRLDAYGRTQEHGRAGNVRFTWEVAQMITEHRGRFEPALEILGRGRAAFAFIANCDPYTYAGRVPLRVAPEARFELGLDLVAPRVVSPASIPRLLTYALRGRGQEKAGDVLYAHDVDRIEIVCDHPMPLQVDGEDLGDITSALFEAERSAVLVLN
jgi:diacylglycerol kinase family enzyme